jgi:hypothetical protein
MKLLVIIKLALSRNKSSLSSLYFFSYCVFKAIKRNLKHFESVKFAFFFYLFSMTKLKVIYQQWNAEQRTLYNPVLTALLDNGISSGLKEEEK